MKVCYFDERDNTLYINTKVILPSGLTSRQIGEYMRKSYEERINESSNKEFILSEMDKHPGCNLSEFMDVQEDLV